MCIYIILIIIFNYFSFQCKNDDTKTHLLFLNQCRTPVSNLLLRQTTQNLTLHVIKRFNYNNNSLFFLLRQTNEFVFIRRSQQLDLR